MKKATLVVAGMAAASLVMSSWAYAQSSHQEHHPDKDAGEQSMPMNKGMKPPQMRGGGMMGQGGMMMGKGMMQGDMMQGGNMAGRCPMMGMMMNSENGDTHAAGRVAFIKAELGITESQQDAFDGYASALKNNLEDMHAMRSRMMSAMQSETPVERLSGHIDMMQGRLATLKQVKPALEKLYGVLSEAQKEKANKVLTGMGCMK